MTLWEISLIGLGLSMDALAVSITDGMCYCTQPLHRKLAIPAFFGFFQGLMPLLGYLTGGLFRDFMSRYAGIIMFVIFAVIGLKMGWDGLHPDPPEKVACRPGVLSYRVLLLQALATSLDAFAVGIGFSALPVMIWPAALLIAAITLVICLAALWLGVGFGARLGSRAQLVGAGILIALAVKSLF